MGQFRVRVLARAAIQQRPLIVARRPLLLPYRYRPSEGFEFISGHSAELGLAHVRQVGSEGASVRDASEIRIAWRATIGEGELRILLEGRLGSGPSGECEQGDQAGSTQPGAGRRPAMTTGASSVFVKTSHGTEPSTPSSSTRPRRALQRPRVWDATCRRGDSSRPAAGCVLAPRPTSSPNTGPSTSMRAASCHHSGALGT